MQRKQHSLALLLAISAAPVLLAWLFFFNPQWLPTGRANHGELVQPPVPVASLSLDAADGSPVELADFRSKWLLLLEAGECGAGCRRLVLAMRQVRLAMGGERERIARLLLLRQPPDDALTKGFPSMRTAVLSEFGRARWHGIAGATDGLYLIDPMGNLMMRYPMDVRPEHLLSDLQRLLKVSKHWRTNARD